MSEFRILFALSAADAAGLADFHRAAAAALAVDGYAPFNEQALFDLQAGRRSAYLVRAAPAVVAADANQNSAPGAATTNSSDDLAGPDPTRNSAPGAATTHDLETLDSADTVVVGAAIGGRGEIDLVISPEYRRRGFGRAAARELIGTNANGLTAWAHGDHPGARALASELRFVAARTLLELRMPLPGGAEVASTGAGGESISAFRVGVDDAEWVALNALVFATHPEQGAITEADLAARQAESWFNADDFLILRDQDGRMIGYNWLKVEQPIGEIYVIGVHPEAAGHGLGRSLMQAGLQRLTEARCLTAALYVEADSLGPVHLYRTLGFVDHTVDVQYLRLTV